MKMMKEYENVIFTCDHRSVLQSAPFRWAVRSSQSRSLQISLDLDQHVFTCQLHWSFASLRTLYSTNLCMYWDRFAPDTAGGAWSPQAEQRILKWAWFQYVSMIVFCAELSSKVTFSDWSRLVLVLFVPFAVSWSFVFRWGLAEQRRWLLDHPFVWHRLVHWWKTCRHPRGQMPSLKSQIARCTVKFFIDAKERVTQSKNMQKLKMRGARGTAVAVWMKMRSKRRVVKTTEGDVVEKTGMSCWLGRSCAKCYLSQGFGAAAGK